MRTAAALLTWTHHRLSRSTLGRTIVDNIMNSLQYKIYIYVHKQIQAMLVFPST
jgi:hypothetical protein